MSSQLHTLGILTLMTVFWTSTAFMPVSTGANWLTMFLVTNLWFISAVFIEVTTVTIKGVYFELFMCIKRL